MRFIILLLVLVGCGGGTDSTSLRQPESPRSTSVDRPVLEDDTLSVYVEEFYATATQKNVATSKLVDSIIFVESYESPNTVGRCAQYDYGNKTIKRSVSILKSFWEKASSITKRSLIFHELGHCALSLPHRKEPGHIMSEYLISDKVALEKWDILVDELFDTPPSNFANLVGPRISKLEFDPKADQNDQNQTVGNLFLYSIRPDILSLSSCNKPSPVLHP